VGYTWSRAAVPGIFNAAATGEGAVDETLINTTTQPIPVTYVYSLYSQGSTNTQNVVVVINPLPTAGFTVQDPIPCQGQTYFFQNTSTIGSGTLSYQWAFSDLGTAAASNPSFLFPAVGTFPVTLTATSSAGCSASSTQSITVNETPVAGFAFTVLTSPAPFEWRVQFTTTSMAGNTTIASNVYQFGGPPNVTEPNPSFVYLYQNLFFNISAQLTATTAQGCPGYASNEMLIPLQNNGAPNPISVGFAVGQQGAINFCVGATAYIHDNTGLPAGYTYIWDFGDNTQQTGVDMRKTTHVYTQPGAYVINETITNNGGLSATSTSTSVNVYGDVAPITTFPVTTAITLCPGQTAAPIGLGPTQQATQFAWTYTGNAAPAPPANNGAFIPALTGSPNNNGAPLTGTIQVTATSPYGCGVPQTLTIPVTDNPTPAITGNFPAQTVCSGATVTGYNLTGTPVGVSFTWSNSDPVTGLSGSGSGNIPSFTGTSYAPAPETSTITALATLNGCTATTKYTFTVDPLPDLSTSLNPVAICSGQAFVYTPLSQTAGISFNWSRAALPGLANPGATGTGGIDETLINTLPTPLTVPYVYTLSANNCSNTQDVDVVINPQPVINLPAGATQTLCNGALSTAVPLIGSIPGTTYSWTNSNAAIGLPASGTGDVPAFQATDAGNAPVSGTILVSAQIPAGCTSAAPASFAITVDPAQPPIVAVPDGTLLCQGDSVPIDVSGASSYQWYANGQPIAGATGSVYDAYGPGAYTVTAITGLGCRDSSAAATNITAISSPTVAFDYPSPYCVDEPVLFTNTSTEAGGLPLVFRWYDSRGHSSTASSPSFTYPAQGDVSVTLVATPQACAALADSLTRTIVISPPTPGIQLPEVNTIANQATPLNAPVVAGAIYNWTPATGLSGTTISDPVATLTASQVYYVTITTVSACSTTDTLQVRVIPKDLVYIPNAFSPNGDSRNDLFVIVGINNYPGSVLEIFDRWGKRVYFSPNYQNNWDGGGLPVGTYVYVLQLNTGNGSKLYKGFLVLLR
jgi:gliding motility-associated-like protein